MGNVAGDFLFYLSLLPSSARITTRVRRALKRLDDTLLTIPFQPNLKEPVPPKNPTRPHRRNHRA